MNVPTQFGSELRACTLALALGISFLACSSSNPIFCDQRNTCDDEDLNFCDIDHKYPASILANECIARPSVDACNRAEPCADVNAQHCTNESMGICVACTKNIHCAGSLNCDPRTNECTAETIIACEPGSEGDATCAESGEELPYCGQEAICVGCLDNNHCTADVAAAICDEESFSCRGCIANSECTSRVCGEGICADEADIVYVDKVTGADSASCGTVLDPCATIGAGIGQSSGTRNTVLIAEGTYLERITILNKDVRLRGEGRVVVQANLADSEHVLSVSGVSDVDIQDMEFGMLAAPATADAVLCTTSTTSLILRNVTVNEASDTGVVGDNCTLSLVGSTIIASGGIGVEMTGGTLNMHASFVLLNANGGIDIDDANYSLVNNIVNNNGGPGSVIGGVRIERTSARNEEFLFNTVAQNSRASGATTGSALRCELSNVVASSNIFMLEDTSSAALVTGCSTQYSLFDTADTMPVGTGNISAEAVFINPAARDFHLDPSSPGNDSAEPGTGVATDIDGNERPLQDAPDMGADQTP